MNLQTWIVVHILFALVLVIPALRFYVFTKNRRQVWLPAIVVALLVIDFLIGLFFPDYRNF